MLTATSARLLRLCPQCLGYGLCRLLALGLQPTRPTTSAWLACELFTWLLRQPPRQPESAGEAQPGSGPYLPLPLPLFLSLILTQGCVLPDV